MLNPSRSKRQHLTDQHGWTHIVSRQDRRYAPPHTSLKPASIPPGLTLEAVKRSADRYQRRWKESLCFRTFTEHFEKEVLPSIHVTIDRCICLGLGSITGGRGSEWWELVALGSILEILRIVAMLLCSIRLAEPAQVQRMLSMTSTFKILCSMLWTSPSCAP